MQKKDEERNESIILTATAFIGIERFYFWEI